VSKKIEKKGKIEGTVGRKWNEWQRGWGRRAKKIEEKRSEERGERVREWREGSKKIQSQRAAGAAR